MPFMRFASEPSGRTVRFVTRSGARKSRMTSSYALRFMLRIYTLSNFCSNYILSALDVDGLMDISISAMRTLCMTHVLVRALDRVESRGEMRWIRYIIVD